MEHKDYYSTLGVSRDADSQTIKKAFRKLAREYHPDVNVHNKDAEQKFKEINEAYAVLSDPERRREYDRLGAHWQQYNRAGGFNWAGWVDGAFDDRPQPGGEPADFEQVFDAEGGGGFADILEKIFGSSEQQQHTSRPGRRTRVYTTEQPFRRSQTVLAEISLEEAFHGTVRMVQQGGVRFEVTIPRGVRTGSKVHVRSRDQYGTPADLDLNIEVRPHPEFSREDDDLRVRVSVDLYTALLGGEVQVPTLERPVMLAIPSGTQNGKLFRLKGLGMPNLRSPDQRGHLLVEVYVHLPEQLSEEERQLFKQLRALRSQG